MPSRLTLLLVLSPIVLGASPLAGQDHRWTFGVALGRAEVGGTSRDTATADGPGFRPHDPTTVSLSAARHLGRFQIGLMGSYGRGDFAIEGPDLMLADKNTVFTFYEIAPVVGIRMTHLGQDGELMLLAGPVLASWSLTTQPDRTRVGGLLGVSLPVWFGSRLAGVAWLKGVVTPSVFEEGELPPEFILTATWRVELSLGILGGF